MRAFEKFWGIPFLKHPLTFFQSMFLNLGKNKMVWEYS